jgi:peptide/nickel transport system ATP-binding protein
VITVAGLTVEYGALRAVDRVSFAVPEGQVFGLVGESGSGKSTILRCLAGLNPGWSGRVSIDGRPLAPGFSRERARLMQMVFQDPYGSLHPRHTIRRALLEPVRIHRLDREGERVERALADVGLDPSLAGRYPHQLSGGQRQRVAIARALILEPPILLLDEPTSALDVSIQAEIVNLLNDLQERRDLTMLLVSHDLGVVSCLCDRLVVLRHGRVVEELSGAELAEGRVASAYGRELLRASQGYDPALAGRAG